MPRSNRQGAQQVELEEVVGREGPVDLAAAFGGTRLYMPENIPMQHDIVRAIGADAVRKLGSGPIDVSGAI